MPPGRPKAAAAPRPTPGRAAPNRASPRTAPPGEVRLIGGQWRRSRLPVPQRPGLRPTPDRVRETLFNWLGQTLDGWRVLDAFAGSGALGFEAASRGAAEVVLLERDPVLVQALQASQARLGATTLSVQRADALPWMAACAPARFELVLLDPPFDAGLALPALRAAALLVVPGGFVYLETGEATAVAGTAVEGLAPWREGRAGAVRFGLYRRG